LVCFFAAFLSSPYMVLFFCVTFYFQIISLFSFSILVLQKDKRTGRPKIWLYRDKETNEPKGDATVTYEDPHAAAAAVEWFNNKDFHGNTIGVFIAESKNKDDQTYNSIADPGIAGNVVAPEETEAESDVNGVNGRGRGQIDASSKPWQQEGDWMCPNTRSVI
jgi:hypothetical protein